jgi:hypothetical protein
VLNRIPRNRDYYYGGYKYYSPYSKNGYYGEDAKAPAREPVPEVVSSQAEPAPSYSFLGKVAKLSKSAEELPPPDPPKS